MLRRYLATVVALTIGLFGLPVLHVDLVVASVSAPTVFTNRTGTNSNINAYSVAYGNGVWVKIYSSTTPYYSTDSGETWTLGTSNVSSGTFQNIEYVNGRFFALCESSCTAGKQIQYSDNGQTWTAASVPTSASIPVNDAKWRDIAYGNGVMVVVGSGMDSGNETANRVLRSTDNGATWQVQQFPQTSSSWPISYESANAVVFAKGKFVTVGSRAMTSTDGITWSTSTNFGAIDLAYGNGVFLAVSYMGVGGTNGMNHAWVSSDGSSWSMKTHGDLSPSGGTAYVHRVRFGNGVFLFGSSEKFVTTGTGSTFSTPNNWLASGSGQWRGLGFGQGIFMAVGDTSNGGASRTIVSSSTTDSIAPTLTQRSPADGATEISHQSNIVLTFSENVVVGSGARYLVKKSSDNSTVLSVNSDSSEVSVSGTTVTINPTSDMPAATSLYLIIESGVVTDIAGNPYAGISSTSGYTFATAADTTAPGTPSTPDLLVGSDSGVSSTDNITSATSPIIATTPTESGGTVTITASSSGVEKSCTLTANGYCSMTGLTDGEWSVRARHVDDYANASAWSSALIVVIDRTAPSLQAVSPSRDATDVGISENIQLTYNETVAKGTSGDVLVKSGSSCGTTDQTIAVTNASVSVSGAVVTINPPANFSYSTVTCLSFVAGVFRDVAGNNAPLHDPTVAGRVRFTTEAADTMAPTANITEPSSPSSSRSLSYSVTFSESVSGLAAGDFSNTGTASCTITVGSFSGLTVPVSVTCSTDGTVVLRLAANSVTDAASNTGPPSAVTATSVTINTSSSSNNQQASSTTTSPSNGGTTTTIASSGSPGAVPGSPTGTGSPTATTVAGGLTNLASNTTVASATRQQNATAAVAVPTTTTTVATAPTTTLAPADVPEVSAGGGALVIGGRRIEATITRENNQLVISAGPLVARISAILREGGRAPLDADGRLRISPLDSIEVEVSGFGAETDVEVRMYSDPVLLGRSQVNDSGELLASYEVPEGIDDGDHTVVMLGRDDDNEEVTFALNVVVGEESNGPSVAVYLIVIPLGLAVLGALIIPAAIRRRREREAL